jgi:hypothetical protein
MKRVRFTFFGFFTMPFIVLSGLISHRTPTFAVSNAPINYLKMLDSYFGEMPVIVQYPIEALFISN